MQSQRKIIENENFSGQVLIRHDFRRTTYIDCDFTNANLRDSNLEYAGFFNCKLKGVNLSGSSLRNVQFNSCDLTGVDMRIADLSHAIINGSILNDALLGGMNIFDTAFDNITVNQNTLFGDLRSKMGKKKTRAVNASYQRFYFKREIQDKALPLMKLVELGTIPKEIFALIAVQVSKIMDNSISEKLKALRKIFEINRRLRNGETSFMFGNSRLDRFRYQDKFDQIGRLLDERRLCDYEKWIQIQSLAKQCIACDDKAAKEISSGEFPARERRLIEAILNDELIPFAKHFENIVNSADSRFVRHK